MRMGRRADNAELRTDVGVDGVVPARAPLAVGVGQNQFSVVGKITGRIFTRLGSGQKDLVQCCRAKTRGKQSRRLANFAVDQALVFSGRIERMIAPDRKSVV